MTGGVHLVSATLTESSITDVILMIVAISETEIRIFSIDQKTADGTLIHLKSVIYKRYPERKINQITYSQTGMATFTGEQQKVGSNVKQMVGRNRYQHRKTHLEAT